MAASEGKSLLFSHLHSHTCFSTADVRQIQPKIVNTPILLRPIVVAKFYPELQPGYGHDDSLGADDSYAFVPNSDGAAESTNSFQRPPPDYSHKQLTVSHPGLKKSSTSLKKLLSKPKMMMKVSLLGPLMTTQ